MERADLLAVPDLGEAGADRVLEIIDELTVVEGEEPAAPASAPEGEDGSEEVEVAEVEAVSDDVAVEGEEESPDDEEIEAGAGGGDAGEEDLQS
jgi:hypothetical protein